ncbi:hypothetical protein ACFYO0_38420 [Streptomyces sp. NPDC006365]|uniref:hypothetical protein n=1 Tax=Streptomyces sp. NPDC006365 TaxID=3364744 RepID=UPI0036CC4C0C
MGCFVVQPYPLPSGCRNPNRYFTDSWSWERSAPVAGDFNGDGKTDIGVLCNRGTTAEDRIRHALWTFTSTGDSVSTPRQDWDGSAQRAVCIVKLLVTGLAGHGSGVRGSR